MSGLKEFCTSKIREKSLDRPSGGGRFTRLYFPVGFVRSDSRSGAVGRCLGLGADECGGTHPFGPFDHRA